MKKHNQIFFIISLTIIISIYFYSTTRAAVPFFNSPIPPPNNGEAIWCTDIDSAFVTSVQAITFTATITNLTYVNPPGYVLNIPTGRLYVGVWQEQNRRQTDTGHLFAMPDTLYNQSQVITGSFSRPASGSPVRYYLRLWDSVAGAWGKGVCEPIPIDLDLLPAEPPPPQPTNPISGTWQTDYSPVFFTWTTPVLPPGASPVEAYQFEIIEGVDFITSTTAISFSVSADQSLSWRIRARNSAGWGRWSAVQYYGIDATPPILSPITETHGLVSHIWQGTVSQPSFIWSGYDVNLKGYYYTWSNVVPCTPATWTTTPALTPTTSGRYLCVQAEDEAGNLSATRSFTFNYDPPAFELGVSPLTLSGYPGQSLTTTATLTNHSRSADTFTVTLTGPATGWPRTISLAGQAVNQQMLSTSLPLTSPANTVQQVTLIATSQLSPALLISRHFTTTVFRPDGLAVVGSDSRVRRPGEVGTYILVLTNGAALPVTFNLAVSSTWPFSLPSTLAVAGLSSQTFALVVSFPAAAAAGEMNMATLTASAPGTVQQVTLTGAVNRLDSLTAAVAYHKTAMDGTAVYSLTMTNGSATTDTFTIDTASAWLIEAPVRIIVGGKISRTFAVTITLPGGVVSGSLTTSLITATSQTNPAVYRELGLTTETSRVDRLQMKIKPAGRVVQIKQATPVVIEIQVEYLNHSNYEDKLSVSYHLPRGWPPGTLSPVETIGMAQTLPGTLVFTVPNMAVGNYTIPLTVIGHYSQTVTNFNLGVINYRLLLPLILLK